LQDIADIFKTSDNQLASIQTIEKSKDATSIIITVNNKKISISAGPTIAEYKEEQEKEVKAKEITIPFIEGK